MNELEVGSMYPIEDVIEELIDQLQLVRTMYQQGVRVIEIGPEYDLLPAKIGNVIPFSKRYLQ